MRSTKMKKIHYWEDVYGFDYTPFIKTAMEEPLVDTVNNQSLITKGTQFFEFDINTVTKSNYLLRESLSYKQLIMITVMPLLCTGMLYSQVNKESSYQLTNAPIHPLEADSFLHGSSLDLKKGDTINGEITAVPSKINPRELDIDISWEVKTQANDKSRELKGGYTYFYVSIGVRNV